LNRVEDLGILRENVTGTPSARSCGDCSPDRDDLQRDDNFDFGGDGGCSELNAQQIYFTPSGDISRDLIGNILYGPRYYFCHGASFYLSCLQQVATIS